MKIKKLISLLMVFALLMTTAIPAMAEETAAEEKFEGSRTLEFVADVSDLENFVTGGRFEFEKTLRADLPAGVSFENKTNGRDYHLSLTFSFKTYNEYIMYMTSVLSYEPSILYNLGDEITFVEGFESLEVLNFIQFSVDEDLLSEKNLKEIFIVNSNKLTLNGKEYSGDERLTVLPEGEKVVKLDGLDIVTSIGSNGLYNRVITAEIINELAEATDIDTVEERFKGAGEITVDNSEFSTTISVEMADCSKNDMVAKTIACLFVPVTISEEKSVANKKNVSVKRTEFIDTTALKRDDDFSFNYEFSVPKYYSNISSEEDGVTITGGVITTTGNNIRLNYEQPFAFSGLKISTDMSSLTLRKTRVIDFTAPVYLAENYHENTKSTLQEKLINGVTLEIYDA